MQDETTEEIRVEQRRAFAEEIRALGALDDGAATERVLNAFASIAREQHVFPGPWTLRSPIYPNASRQTPDSDPAHLYHCVLVALDESAGINIGEPSLWARTLARSNIARGSRVLQIGAGSGYYTAILAELVGSEGSVLGFEVNERLAQLASNALSERANAEVRFGNGVLDLTSSDGPFDLIIVFAGLTHPSAAWLDVLGETCRMLLPVTGTNGWGAILLCEPHDRDTWAVTTLGLCGFYPCTGARDETFAARIDEMWQDRSRLSGCQMTMTRTNGAVSYSVGEDVYTQSPS